MTNVPFTSIKDFRDLDSINAYYELTEKKVFTEEEMMEYLRYKSRDNARTPMQWDDSENAGFTSGTPWIMVNPNYREINAAQQQRDPDSVLAYYKKLIRLRKENDNIVYGAYDLLEPESQSLYVYTRTLEEKKLLVVCNFTSREETYSIPEPYRDAQILISNYNRKETGDEIILKPYEALVLSIV